MAARIEFAASLHRPKAKLSREMATTAALLVLVAFAFTVETTLGFGATIVTVAIGSLFLPTETILWSFVPINVILSAVLVARDRRAIALRMLITRVAPFVLVGVPLGLFAASAVPERLLKLCLGVATLSLAAVQLRPTKRVEGEPAAPPEELSPWLARPLLFAGGVLHGAFGSGGPMVVYVLGRAIGRQKTTFRATLSLLWLILNAVLLFSFVRRGHIGEASLQKSAGFGLAMLVGLLVGQKIHDRVDAKRFQVAIFAMLGAVGLVLVIKNVL
jgi:uncharacterized protein